MLRRLQRTDERGKGWRWGEKKTKIKRENGEEEGMKGGDEEKNKKNDEIR
jgi:hypothetical protein